LKKARKSSSARKSSRSSKGIFSGGSSFGSRKPRRKKKPISSGSGKFFPQKSLKDRFIKPSNDPGPKIRDEEVGVHEEFEGGPAQQALQSTGRGCCSSITGFFWMLGLGSIAVIIILAIKCGGC